MPWPFPTVGRQRTLRHIHKSTHNLSLQSKGSSSTPHRPWPTPFARVVHRGRNRVNWAEVARLVDHASHGRTSLRRFVALLHLFSHDVTEHVARNSMARPSEAALSLGERKIRGACGERLPEWNLGVNLELGR